MRSGRKETDSRHGRRPEPAVGPADRRGFTLTELIIVVLLGTLLLAAAYQVLITNQRTYTVNAARIQAGQTVRAGLDVLTGELREVSASGGDILRMDDDTLAVRALRGVALVCDVDAPGSKIVVRPWGRGMTTEDSIYVFADNDVERSSDDVWLRGDLGTVSSGNCPDGTSGQILNLPNMSGAMSADSVRSGALARAYNRYLYGAMSYDGDVYLGRKEPDQPAQPLVGPLRAGDGVAFTYFDENGNATTVPTDVALIRVVLRTPIDVRMGGEPVADSVVAWIHTRN